MLRRTVEKHLLDQSQSRPAISHPRKEVGEKSLIGYIQPAFVRSSGCEDKSVETVLLNLEIDL